ncbi:Signal transduction histidine kinase [Paramaledivibacter caminithermalis DSM 15212]|jgi:two-component system sensor histidine kinase CssS|uniref:histidine kinase n=2 Tax=Paramaledivibacter TaxID=1884934 RepID=A0A1M6RE74_PARC5|nr:Signal transduction histidine kinase [Paramaledivibacter caminithermalis DSM 15212]
MDMGIRMKKNSMKNKPLGFQIWIIITIFIILIAVVVFVTTIITINNTSDFYINIFDKALFGNLLKLMICIIIVSIIAAKMISNTVTKPIRFLERKVRLIANKKWIKNIKIDRKDEIGKLAYSISKMQENLEKLDKEEEFFLQSLSHELKTPIMVIKNYCQALRDGIYINDSMDDTINVIEEEVNALGTKIGKLLYISSLEYVLEKEDNFDEIELKKMIEHLAGRLCNFNEDIKLELQLEKCFVMGIEEKLQVAIENVLDNCIRYARTYIKIITKKISASKHEGFYVEISIINDGDHIPKEVRTHLFNKFYKGSNGNFGLGLYITKKIIEFHKGNVYIENSGDEVIFTIKLPCVV